MIPRLVPGNVDAPDELLSTVAGLEVREVARQEFPRFLLLRLGHATCLEVLLVGVNLGLERRDSASGENDQKTNIGSEVAGQARDPGALARRPQADPGRRSFGSVLGKGVLMRGESPLLLAYTRGIPSARCQRWPRRFFW